MAIRSAAFRQIKRVTRREDTTLRPGGYGDCFHMSWAADDAQLVAQCDGSGWPGTRRRLYNSRLYRVRGRPEAARFEEVPHYPELLHDPSTPGGFSRYYGLGTLALDASIYQFLGTPNVPFDQPNPRFVGAKLIYSSDSGGTWRNQDGSPLVWESWETRSSDNMVFFEESQDAFSLLTILQMGKNYEANKDGYVYIYAPNGNTEGTMNELVMFRVPQTSILDRSLYQYFSGMRNGAATWTKEIDLRDVVHTFPRGWVNSKIHPWAWIPSVVYNAPLGLYMMANWATGCADDGQWFDRPSYLGLWTAPDPWGPWTQIHEETAWTPNNDPRARAYQPQIAPKWIAEDGKSFWLAWSDFQDYANADWDVLREEWERLRAEAPSEEQLLESVAAAAPSYTLQLQRVDLELGSSE